MLAVVLQDSGLLDAFRAIEGIKPMRADGETDGMQRGSEG